MSTNLQNLSPLAQPTSAAPVAAAAPPTPLVESGPVVYDDAAGEEDEDEEEETCVSAMALMGAQGQRSEVVGMSPVTLSPLCRN